MSAKMLTASTGLASAASRRAAVKPFGASRPLRFLQRGRCVQPVRAVAEAVAEPVAEPAVETEAPVEPIAVPARFSPSSLVKSFEADMMRKSMHPELEIGDQVTIEFVVVEKSTGPARDKMGNLLKSSAAQKDKQRIQKSQGIIIAKHGDGLNQTYTFRRVFQGIGLEIVFPINSPQVKSISVFRHSKVRRAKLHYLRGKIGKKARLTARTDRKPASS
jgi:large subunit ribosomal protein L19